jgi:hypothetical protein
MISEQLYRIGNAVVACSDVLPRYLSGGTEENHETHDNILRAEMWTLNPWIIKKKSYSHECDNRILRLALLSASGSCLQLSVQLPWDSPTGVASPGFSATENMGIMLFSYLCRCVEPEMNTNNIYKISSYLTGNSRCLLWEPYGTHRHTLLAECRVLVC